VRFRALGAALAALALVGCDGCGARPSEATPRSAPAPAPSAPPPRASASASAPAALPLLPAKEITWQLSSSELGPLDVVVLLPERRQGERFPVLVALHGRGEAFKGPKRGARGWVEDYELPAAVARLHAPPLTETDFKKFVEPDRLDGFNQTLARHPYRGLIVVCPYTPDVLAGDKPFSAVTPFSKLVVDELLPRVKRELPAIGTPAATGIDGVSLGGRVSVLVGFERPEAFGAVAGLQPAFDSADAPELARRAKAAREANPRLRIRLLTSDGDFFLNATRAISKAFDAAGVQHDLAVVPGPHDYPFNRGPGAYEMLLFHDRALRGQGMFD
jgi:iron(III)-salmochelin esterase